MAQTVKGSELIFDFMRNYWINGAWETVSKGIKMHRILNSMLFILLITVSNSVFSYSECRLTPTKVWINQDGVSVWICFEGRSCIYTHEPQLNELKMAILDRIYSAGLTAITAQKNLVVRFPEDSLDCSTVLMGHSRDDFVGFWIERN